MNETKTALVVGGTNGLGQEIAAGLKAQGYGVYVAGRQKRSEEFGYLPLAISSDPVTDIQHQLTVIASAIGPCDLLVYATGFYQEGFIDDLSDSNIKDMMLAGVEVPAMLLSRLLYVQDNLPGFIAITSTSQFTPRQKEPVYTAAKAGLGMLARSLAEDDRIGKVLVAAPAGMKTDFWKGTNKDTSDMLDPKWVAEKVLQAYNDTYDFKYKFLKIHRNPPRTELADNIGR